MILIQAAKLATAQRKVVRKFAQHQKGEFDLGRLGKFSSIKKVPKYLKEYANDIVEISGEYSKNPIKKVVSWVKSYINNVKFAKKWVNELSKLKKAEANAAETASSSVPKPKRIIFDKNDI